MEFFVSLITVIYPDNVSHNDCGFANLTLNQSSIFWHSTHIKISDAHANNMTICAGLYAGLVERFFASSHYYYSTLTVATFNVFIYHSL